MSEASATILFLLVELGVFGVVSVFSIIVLVRARQRWLKQHNRREPVTVRELVDTLAREVSETFWLGDPRPVILWMSTVTLAIGMFLLLPLDSFSQVRAYAYLAETPFDETAWAYTLITLSVLKFLLFAFNGVRRERRDPTSLYLATLLLILMAIVWANIALGVAFSSYESFGWVVYVLFSAAHLWCASRRLHQARGGS